MIYDSLARNRRILDNLFGRKVFKKHCFINDNEEGYKWDNYISYVYNDKKDYRYRKSYKTTTTQATPQTSNSSTQTSKHFTNVSTQTTPQTKDSTTQTEPIEENKIPYSSIFYFLLKTFISNKYY